MSTPPPTQTEILERQEAAVAQLEANSLRMDQFINGPASDTVSTESGPIPTLSGLLEEVRQRVGSRRYEISFSVNDLFRYANEGEALFRVLPTAVLYTDGSLSGSVWRLNTPPSGADFDLKIKVHTYEFTVRFPSGSQVGTVVASTLTSEVQLPAFPLIEGWVVGEPVGAEGLFLTLLLLADPPTP